MGAALSVALWAPAARAGGLGCYSEEIRRDQPTLYWRLGDPSSPMLDTSGHGYSGVAGGSVRFVEPSAFQTDGDGSIHVDGNTGNVASQPLHLAGDFSIELWSKAATPIETQHAVMLYASDTNARYIQLLAGRFVAGVRTDMSALTSSALYDVSTWHHVVFTLSGGTQARLFVDGVPSADATLAAVPEVTGPVTLAWEPAVVLFDNRFEGWLDEVAIYQTALPAGRISDHYTAGIRPPATAAVGDACCIDADCSKGRCVQSVCSDAGTSVDAGSVDAGSVDAGHTDAGSKDAGGTQQQPEPPEGVLRDPFVQSCASAGGLGELSLAAALVAVLLRRAGRGRR
jgi:hypothetical protein